MTSIPSFGESLLSNRQANVETTRTAEEIINAPQYSQVPDSFQYSGETQEPKKSRSWLRPLGYLATAGILFFAGRKGVFGKHIKKWFGGLPSAKTVTKNIETKMQEYLGKGGSNVSKTLTETTPDGSTIITFELQNGSRRVFQRFDTKNFVRLEGKAPDGRAEMIVFRKDDGTPVSRTLFKLSDDGKIMSYKSYKDAKVLDSGFNDSEGLFKSYERGSKGKRYGLFGRTQRTDKVVMNTNPEAAAGNVLERTLIYDEPNKVTRMIIKNPDGTVTYKKLYTQQMTHSDGSAAGIYSKFLETDSKFNFVES